MVACPEVINVQISVHERPWTELIDHIFNYHRIHWNLGCHVHADKYLSLSPAGQSKVSCNMTLGWPVSHYSHVHADKYLSPSPAGPSKVSHSVVWPWIDLCPTMVVMSCNSLIQSHLWITYTLIPHSALIPTWPTYKLIQIVFVYTFSLLYIQPDFASLFFSIMVSFNSFFELYQYISYASNYHEHF